jgi:DNA-binding PadR family transcriptional regulator
MTQENGDAEALLPLTPAVFQILLALSGGERHGYAIMREVEASTQGQLRIGPGTLYRSIKQMLAQGLIVETEERPDPALDDERRRYYRLTDFGQRVAAAEARRLARLVTQAREKHLLDIPGFDSGFGPGFDPGLGGA